jgi:hypothetical protein
MPSSIVTVATMDCVVDAIREHCTVFDDIPVKDRTLSKIGAKLFAMNFIAVKMDTGAVEPLPTYCYTDPALPAPRAMAHYRAINSLLEHCRHDAVRDTASYKALDLVRVRLALELADATVAASADKFLGT